MMLPDDSLQVNNRNPAGPFVGNARAEVRYFRVFQGDVVNGGNLGTVNFWRLSAGLVFR